MAVHSNMVFDIGMHEGEDTNFYLKKGFKVVAFEANPELIARCKSRFVAQIASGQLYIVEGAIALESSNPNNRIVFFKNRSLSVWGTVDADRAQRNDTMGHASERIEVDRVDIANAFRTHGMPYYLKIDIEGADRLVLNTLKECGDRPSYLSIESDKVDFSEVEFELNLLRDLGYKHFQAVQQKRIPGSRIVIRDLHGQSLEHVFEKHSSGPFGDDLPTPWLSYDECRRDYIRIFRNYRLIGDNSRIRKIKVMPRIIQRIEILFGISLPGWYDSHAKLD